MPQILYHRSPNGPDRPESKPSVVWGVYRTNASLRSHRQSCRLAKCFRRTRKALGLWIYIPTMPARSAASGRNLVACVPCRMVKLRCSHHNQTPCDRCRSTGRPEACYFPQKWTSALHRQPKKPRRCSQIDQPNPSISADSSSGAVSNSEDSVRPNCTTGVSLDSFHTTAHLSEAPLQWLTEEVKRSYLRCTYKWSFHHKPRFLQETGNGKIEPMMAWAILALASRYLSLH